MMMRVLIEKEFKQLLRDYMVPKFLIAMPLAMMLIFPWAANQEVRNMKSVIVDNDHSTISGRLVEKIGSSDYFELVNMTSTYRQALNSIEAGDADIIMEIPQGFERNLVQGEAGRVMIAANAVDGVKAAQGSYYLSAILADYSDDLREEYGGTATISMVSQYPSFGVVPKFIFNPDLDYKVFMIPGLIVMLLTMLCGFMPAFAVVSEKERGTIEQINVTPVRKFEFVLAAKLFPYWLIGFVELGLCMVMAAIFYGIVPVGNLVTILLYSVVYILVMSGMGLVVSNYTETMQQAMFVMFFFMMILILMSGLFTPVASMPAWAKAIAAFNPLKYFVEVMRQIYLKGSGFGQLVPQFFALCGFAVAFNVWAVASYRKSS